MTDGPDTGTRQARIDALIAEFRAAQQRRQVKAGIALWNRTEAALRDGDGGIVPADPPAGTIKH